MRDSIRWRLPLSYAGIALLTALALGAVLLLTLGSYYERREQAYLVSNARAMGSAIAPLVGETVSAPAIASQVQGLAFLSQARVRIYTKGGDVLAESLPPGSGDRVFVTALAGPAVSGAEGAQVQAICGTVEGGMPVPGSQDSPTVSFIVIGSEQSVPAEGATFSCWTKPPISVAYPLSSSYAYGAGVVEGDTMAVVPRSAKVVSEPLYDASGDLVGQIQVSDSPSFSRQILYSVTVGWAAASAVAVLLAGAVGWLISRRVSAPVLALAGAAARMGTGELSARAAVVRRDEIGQLAVAFNEMAERVEGTVLALRRFVADAAHELHTPLTALRTNLELLAGGERAPDDAAAIARAREQVERLQALTGGLLELSRAEAGASQANRQPVDVGALVRSLSEAYASRAEQAALSFAVELPEAGATVLGDESQLGRALGNLLDNAIKFTPEGGSVRLGLSLEGAWAELWVEDTGIGIPEADLPHLFSRFHRGANALTYAGNGLGLAIVKAMAEAHGGSVSAESESGCTRFTLRLPVVG